MPLLKTRAFLFFYLPPMSCNKCGVFWNILGQSAIDVLNQALDGDDPDATVRALQTPALKLPPVLDHSESLYHEELRNMKTEKQVTKAFFASSTR
jgi:hypothetical protein